MKLTIEIDCDNDAFTHNPESEIALLLGVVAGKITRGETSARILDSNGNTIGKFSFTEL